MKLSNTLCRVLSGAGMVLAALVVLCGIFFLWLTIVEYRPAGTETLTVENSGGRVPSLGTPLRILAWNLGYAALDASQDFFMDGGIHSRPASKEIVAENIEGIKGEINAHNSDIILLQEVDKHSKRSYYIDEVDALTNAYAGSWSFAYNFKCKYVPIPLFDSIGEVESGLVTLSMFTPNSATRKSLPVPFKWPVRLANLKRCLLVSRFPLENSDKELVIVNLHLEAYDKSGGREAQTKELIDFLAEEFNNGNYCIAGGDFNQTFPNADESVVRKVDNGDYFVPGLLRGDMLPESSSGYGWRFVSDSNSPTSRLNNKPYSLNYDDTQLYIIDGFILSPNVELISVKTIEDMNFRYTDHNAVALEVALR